MPSFVIASCFGGLLQAGSSQSVFDSSGLLSRAGKLRNCFVPVRFYVLGLLEKIGLHCSNGKTVLLSILIFQASLPLAQDFQSFVVSLDSCSFASCER